MAVTVCVTLVGVSVGAQDESPEETIREARDRRDQIEAAQAAFVM